MSLATLATGTDLNSRKLYLSIPTWTEFNSELGVEKVIARTNNGSYLYEIREEDDDWDTGNIIVVHRGGYVSGRSSGNLYNYSPDTVSGHRYNPESITLPSDFGIVTEVDETSVLYQYIQREINEKLYLHTEDHERVEGVSKADFDALVARVAALEGA